MLNTKLERHVMYSRMRSLLLYIQKIETMAEFRLGVWRLAFAFFLFIFACVCETAATVHALFNEQQPQSLTFLFFQPISAHRTLFMDPQISLFNNFFIKNRFHGTIYTFKNYFATVFFSFQFQFLAVSKRTLYQWRQSLIRVEGGCTLTQLEDKFLFFFFFFSPCLSL